MIYFDMGLQVTGWANKHAQGREMNTQQQNWKACMFSRRDKDQDSSLFKLNDVAVLSASSAFSKLSLKAFPVGDHWMG